MMGTNGLLDRISPPPFIFSNFFLMFLKWCFFVYEVVCVGSVGMGRLGRVGIAPGRGEYSVE